MSDLEFAWDPGKEDHSGDEDRFLLLGLSSSLRLLLVVHTYREQDRIIRIMSARKASRRERGAYSQRWEQ